jgi:hypothetical protein
MGFAPFRRARLNQPSGDRVDWANPLSKGLWFLAGISGGIPHDCVTGRQMARTGSPVVTLGKHGRALNATGSTDNFYLTGMPLIPVDSGLTIALLSEVDAQNATRKRPVRLAAGATSVASIDYADGSVQDYIFGVQKVGSVFTNQHGTVAPYPLGPKLLALVQEPAAPATLGYENAVLQTGTASTVAGNLVAPIDSIYLANSGSGFPLTGKLYFAAVWTKALTQKELVALTANPWQLFQ